MKEEKVSVSSKFWLCSADCLCGTLSGLITGGGMTYFYTKYLGLDEYRLDDLRCLECFE